MEFIEHKGAFTCARHSKIKASKKAAKAVCESRLMFAVSHLIQIAARFHWFWHLRAIAYAAKRLHIWEPFREPTVEFTRSDGIQDPPSHADYVRRLQRGETEAFEMLVPPSRKNDLQFGLSHAWRLRRSRRSFPGSISYRPTEPSVNFAAMLIFRPGSIALPSTIRALGARAVIRRQQRNVAIEDTEPVRDLQPGPAETMEKKEIRERVQRALNSLEPDDATVILLRDLQDIPYEEVARLLEIPVGTVKSRLHRARQALKSQLASYFYAGRKAV